MNMEIWDIKESSRICQKRGEVGRNDLNDEEGQNSLCLSLNQNCIISGHLMHNGIYQQWMMKCTAFSSCHSLLHEEHIRVNNYTVPCTQLDLDYWVLTVQSSVEAKLCKLEYILIF